MNLDTPAGAGQGGGGNPNRKRVVCPVTGKDGKTYWIRLGTAFVNRDNSTNVYLDCLPVNGKLQIREWDDPPWEARPRAATLDATGQASFGGAAGRDSDGPPF